MYMCILIFKNTHFFFFNNLKVDNLLTFSPKYFSSMNFLFCQMPETYSLDLFPIYNYSFGDPTQSRAFKYNLYAGDSQTYISSLDYCFELQTHISNCLPDIYLDIRILNSHSKLKMTKTEIMILRSKPSLYAVSPE